MTHLVDRIERQGYRVHQDPTGNWTVRKGGNQWDLGPTPTQPDEWVRLKAAMVAAGITGLSS